MKRWLLAAACGVVALGLLLYPLVGELLSEKYHSDIETSYTAAIKDTDDAELTTQWQAAQQYNAMLANATISEGGASALPWPTPTSSRWAVPWLMWTSLRSVYTCRYSMVRTRKRLKGQLAMW